MSSLLSTSVSFAAIKQISEIAEDVFIEKDGLTNMANLVMEYMLRNYKDDNIDGVINNFTRFTPELLPDSSDRRAADWLFVLNTLNFALWNPKGAKQWTVNGYTGYSALCAAIKRAIDKETPIWDPTYYSKIKQTDLKIIFQGDDETVIPLIEERVEMLREIGDVLLKRYEGTFVQFIKSCKHSVNEMITLLKEFEAYREERTYKDITGHEICIDLIPNNSLCTMFADYRAPQVLLDLKVLRYSKKLVTRLEENDEPLMQESKEELEIRACSLFAMKILNQIVLNMSENYVKQKIPELEGKINYSILIDNFIWDYRQLYDLELMKRVPYHNVRSEYW